MRVRHVPLLLVLGAGSIVGCRDSTGIDTETARAAGVYVLQAPSSENRYGAPESGSMYLSRGGDARREVIYRSGFGAVVKSVSAGTFSVHGQAVDLRLVEQRSLSPYVWSPPATLRGSTLTLRYPGPADGEITETYVRLTSLVP